MWYFKYVYHKRNLGIVDLIEEEQKQSQYNHIDLGKKTIRSLEISTKKERIEVKPNKKG